MASLESKIIIGMEYRPCIVKGKNALFHTWSKEQRVVEPSPMIGGAPGGQISFTVGIVEYEDGTIHKCHPDEVVFLDNNVERYFKTNDIVKNTVPESIEKFISIIKTEDIVNVMTISVYEKYKKFCSNNYFNIESKNMLGKCICNHFEVKSIPKRYGKFVCKTYTKV